MIFFLSAEWDEWIPVFRLTKRYLVYGWATKLVSVKTNKTICAAHGGSKHENMMNERRRQPSTGQDKKTKQTLADSNYFNIEESILCPNFCAHVTPFSWTLRARLQQFVKACICHWVSRSWSRAYLFCHCNRIL